MENRCRDVISDPAGHPDSQIVHKDKPHDHILQRNGHRQYEQSDDRSRHHIESGNLRIRIPQYLGHRNRLGIFFNDHLGKKIQKDHEEHDGKAVHNDHHPAHGDIQLTADLDQSIVVDNVCHHIFADIRNLRVGKIARGIVIEQAKRAAQVLFAHKHAQAAHVVIYSVHLEFIVLVFVALFEPDGIARFDPALVGIGCRDVDLAPLQRLMDIAAVLFNTID